MKMIGKSVPLREDEPLLRGLACFTDDVDLPETLHVSFQRAQVASGKILTIDCTDAREMAGVQAVHTGADTAHLGRLTVNPVLPVTTLPEFPVLAQGELFAVGQAFAAVLASTSQQAMDAAETIFADTTEEPTQIKTVAQKIWKTSSVEQAMAGADLIVECTLHHPRLAPSPMEPRAIAVQYHPETDSVTVWHSTQTPHRSRAELAKILTIDPARICVIARHVGGAFGMKASIYPEDVFTVWAAFHHKRNIKWTASRSEEFLSATHGRGISSTGRLALNKDGQFLAISAKIDAPLGHWLPNSGLIPAWNAGRILPSAYAILEVDITTTAQSHNRAATGIYRGAGRPEAICLMERLVDKAADALKMDPLLLRQKNLIATQGLPFETATGNTLDSGDYSAALGLLAERTDYAALIKDRDRRCGNGELVGIGIGFYVEPSGSGWESVRVTLAEGHLTIQSGSSSQGHHRETAFAQIAADALDLPLSEITVICGDTATCPEGIGALASRSTPIGGSAVLRACQEIKDRLAKGNNTPITVENRYENDGQAWGYGAYLAVLSIDRDTGVPKLEQVTCVDDTGIVINPDLVAGQIRGGFAQGLGEAMMENLIYDTDGQLITGSFMDYALPRARDIPPLAIHKMVTPSPMNALGAKGVGEAGTIGAPAAILNAAIDALRPMGITDLNMPLTSYMLWQAMRDAAKDTL